MTTRDEARRRAVEAAQGEYLGIWHGSTSDEIAEAMVAAFERAMADAGWRMVPEKPTEAMIAALQSYAVCAGYVEEGYAAMIRAAMVGDE